MKKILTALLCLLAGCATGQKLKESVEAAADDLNGGIKGVLNTTSANTATTEPATAASSDTATTPVTPPAEKSK